MQSQVYRDTTFLTNLDQVTNQTTMVELRGPLYQDVFCKDDAKESPNICVLFAKCRWKQVGGF